MAAHTSRRLAACMPPTIECLENRLMLSAATYQLIADNYTAVGNEWDYATTVLASGGTTTGTMVTKVTGTKSVSGLTCGIFETTLSGDANTTSTTYQYLSDDAVQQYGGIMAGGIVSDTVLNNNPMELFPLSVTTAEKNFQYGDGDYTATASGMGTWTIHQDRAVTYVGRQSLTLSIDGQKMSFANCVEVSIVHTQTSSQNSDVGVTLITAWFYPGVGPVKTITKAYSATGDTYTTTTATLTSFSPAPSAHIGVSGDKVAIASGDASPSIGDGTDFGSAVVAKGKVTHTFAIANTGMRTLSITGTPRISVSGADPGDFIVIVQPAATVGVAHSTSFKIRFTPTAEGVRSALVTIASSDPSVPSYTFTIQGTGYIPRPEIAVTGNAVNIPDNLANPSAANWTDFGSAASGAYVIRTFTIQNTGTAALKLGGNPRIVISGADAGDFILMSKPASSVAAGHSTTFKVKFLPKALGLRAAIISITNDDGDGGDGVENPFTFDIKGTGV